jgi:NADPH-dependent curcumin reductase CurA
MRAALAWDQPVSVPFVPAHTTPSSNRRLLLRSRPSCHPRIDDLQLEETARPTISAGQVLVRSIYLSADPVQRGWAAVQPLDTVMRGLAVGVIVESLRAGFIEGDLVFGTFGWQDYCVPAEGDILSHVAEPVLPASAYAGVLGMPGVTAWLALRGIAPPQAGQRVLVSTAAGAVGSVVGQLVSRAGALPYGLTGSPEKVARCLDRFGYIACADYKADDVEDFLSQHQAAGFETFFDNTGGWILDTAIRHMARFGKVIQCGTAATSSWSPPPFGLRNEREVLTRALTWTGFVVFDHRSLFNTAVQDLSRIVVDEGLNFDEDIDHGIERAPAALDDVISGRNVGKKLIFIG